MIHFPLFGSAQLDPSLCAGFRTGTFAYRNDSSNAVLIKRTHHRQEERIKKTGVVTRFKIKWLSPCSYEIKQVWSNSRKIRKNDGAVTQVMITQASRDQYNFKCACKAQEGSAGNTGTVYRVP
jgi:hypothetical protein